MFEKFTKKAIDVIQSAQNYAVQFKHDKVLSSHILLGLISQTKGVQAKILNFDKIDFEKLSKLTQNSTKINPDQKENDNIFFSQDSREILKSTVELTNKLNSKFTMPMHIALAILTNKKCQAYRLIKEFDIDEEKIIPNIERILDKNSDILQIHPENETPFSPFVNINNFFKEDIISQILSNAQAKISASGYEIVGTEQIMQSVLDNKNYKITEILDKLSINSNIFAKKLSEIPSRSAEFENSEKQIIFTPNAFLSLMCALDCAKESGSVQILPEHIVLGILKTKKGIAYKILSSLLPNGFNFEEMIIKNLEDKIPETLAILRLAREEAISFESPTMGSEMILLGILAYGTGVASETLRKLEITLKDARIEVLKLIKPQKDVQNVTFSPRAKKILQLAYETAREHKRTKIKSENLLYGITKVPDCLAMKVLSNLGTDVLEIQQGIKQLLIGGMDL